ncbi:MAG: hypothetical protein U5L96_12850 [Owenweeksia sp.]|nr:hypothetical protein [Owenweeksia sp.]
MNNWLKLTVICCILHLTGFSQEVKMEYEERVDSGEVPRQVLEAISPLLEEADKVKYYFEKASEQDFYEVKMRWRGKLLSVEFYSDGRLMDVEQLVEIDQLPQARRGAISDYFDRQFKRYRFTRVQVQYTSEEELIESLVEEDYEEMEIRYEIEAFVKGEGTKTIRVV